MSLFTRFEEFIDDNGCKPNSADLRIRSSHVARRLRSGASLTAALASFVSVALILIASFAFIRNGDSQSQKQAGLIGAETISESSNQESKEAVKYRVTIRQPSGPPRVVLGVADLHGEKLNIACSTCHATREPNTSNRITTDLDEFHKGMNFSHGTLTCLACHNPTDYDTLHLADRTPLNFQDVMSLCSQCHGTQRRDYDHGAHGGMTGYWDLTRGPRVRNNCVDCHSPHHPKFPKMNPTFKPRDRFLESHSGEHHE